MIRLGPTQFALHSAGAAGTGVSDGAAGAEVSLGAVGAEPLWAAQNVDAGTGKALADAFGLPAGEAIPGKRWCDSIAVESRQVGTHVTCISIGDLAVTAFT